jgi:hypothetical protein
MKVTDCLASPVGLRVTPGKAGLTAVLDLQTNRKEIGLIN